MASNAGSPRTPDWWLNLKAAGTAIVRYRGERIEVRARELEGQERDQILQLYLEAYPPGRHYDQFTDRPLPLILLEPLDMPRIGS
jgi:deazaflavin-dependent oxidoreductase (nitroreductase family)